MKNKSIKLIIHCKPKEPVGSTPRANLSLGTTGKTNLSAARKLPGEIGTHRGRIPLGPGTSCVYRKSHTRGSRGHSWGCRAEETTNTAHPCPHPWSKRKLYKASGLPWGRAQERQDPCLRHHQNLKETDRINSSLHPNPVGGRAKPSERQTSLWGKLLGSPYSFLALVTAPWASPRLPSRPPFETLLQ